MRESYYSLGLTMRIARHVLPVTLLWGALVPRRGLAADAADATRAPADAAVQSSPAPGEQGTDGARGATEPEPPRHARPLRTVGWISLAIGAEAAVVASATSIMLLHEKSVRDSECSAQKVCSQRGFEANGTIASLVAWNTASWAVMAAGLGAGAVLLLTGRPAARVQATVSVSPDAAGVGVHGSF
jgi:hypothetical protein